MWIFVVNSKLFRFLERCTMLHTNMMLHFFQEVSVNDVMQTIEAMF